MSSLYTLDMKDISKALIMTIITAFLTAILAAMESGGFPSMDSLQQAVIVAITAGISYLLKNFLTNSEGQIAVLEKNDK